MPKQAIDYIVPLNMNGLQGRMLRLPASSKAKSRREILVVYGHHALLERWWGLIQSLSAYGNVTMPDMPGFGGMSSFRKVGVKTNVDSYADYLASFIKLRYKHHRLKIVGISYGFVVITRMLERYPDLAGKIDVLVSANGFSHYDDFRFTKIRKFIYRMACLAVSMPVISTGFKIICLNPIVLRMAYARTFNGRPKFKNIKDNKEFERTMHMETKLWNLNDVRTHMLTAREFLAINNCSARIPLVLEHIYSKNDHYFDKHYVEQHLRIIFQDVNMHEAKLDQHVTSVIATKAEASKLLPKAVRAKLSA